MERPRPKAILKRARVPALLISNLLNIRYLLNVSLSAGVLLVLPRKFHLFVDGRYREVASKAVGGRRGVLVSPIEDLAKVMARVRSCGFEGKSVSVSTLRSWKRRYRKTRFRVTDGVIEEFRRRKGSDELRRIRRALRITEILLRRVPRALRKFPTERELAWSLECFARQLGAEELAFPPIVAFGSHTSHPHHHPTDRKLKAGAIVQIDIGAKADGYCADRSEVYFFRRKPTKEERRALSAVRRAKEEAKKAARRGASTRMLDRIARGILKNFGMEEAFCHSLGHGVGLEIHEGVSLSEKAKEKRLLRGEVITIEPGVYFPGKFGIRLEDMVFIR